MLGRLLSNDDIVTGEVELSQVSGGCDNEVQSVLLVQISGLKVGRRRISLMAKNSATALVLLNACQGHRPMSYVSYR